MLKWVFEILYNQRKIATAMFWHILQGARTFVGSFDRACFEKIFLLCLEQEHSSNHAPTLKLFHSGNKCTILGHANKCSLYFLPISGQLSVGFQKVGTQKNSGVSRQALILTDVQFTKENFVGRHEQCMIVHQLIYVQERVC